MLGDEFYLTAFWDLDTCRTFGLSVGPIPWDRIVDYTHYSGLEDDVARVFVRTIRTMDNVYLNWVAKKSGNKLPNKDKG